MKWNKLIARKMTEEEKEIYPQSEYIWDGKTPGIDEEVLVFTPETGVKIDTWLNFYKKGEGFENTILENGNEVYWMMFPSLQNKKTNRKRKI